MVADAKRAYYERNREVVLARVKAWRAANPDRVREITAKSRKKRSEARTEYQRKWRSDNPERARQINKDHYHRHPERRRSYARQWRADNPDRVRTNFLKRYGLTVAEHEAMLAVQGGACAICKKASDQALCIDHDHQTGEVRGLLCVPCNTLVGRIEAADLDSIAKYLGWA